MKTINNPMRLILVSIIVFGMGLLWITKRKAQASPDESKATIEVTGSLAMAGDKIIVTLTGEPDGEANFSITGLVRKAAMTETKPGTYTGEYIVKEGQNVKNAIAFATLKTSSTNFVAVDTNHLIMVDTTVPVVKATIQNGKSIYRDGDTIHLEAQTEPGAYVVADLSAINPTQPTLPLEEKIPGIFEGSAKINIDNPESGTKQIAILALDIVGNTGATALTIDYATSSSTHGAITMTFHEGINLMSVPVKLEGWRLSDLARHIGLDDVKMIVCYDYDRNRFLSYLPATTPEDAKSNAPVQCGEGYIVIMGVEKNVTFEGYNCADEVVAAPSWVPLVFNDNRGTSIFVVTGVVVSEETGEALNDVTITIRNLRTGQTLQDKTGAWAGSGRYVVTFIASEAELMTRAMDKLEITAQDANNRLTIEPVIHTLTSEAIANWALVIPLRLSLPKQSTLLQNYPNSFNPETWIPYQIHQPAEVVIRIYDTAGRLVRTLSLGQREAGFYFGRSRAASWDGNNDIGEKVSSGVYFYQLQAGDFSATRKLVIVK